jgi:transposase
MDNRLYPLKENDFINEVEPYIIQHYRRAGRPPKLSHYLFFCAVLYVLRTGISWRDLPKNFGPWPRVYMRFKRWSENGLFWGLVYQLQQAKKLTVDMSWVDSTTIPIHRHGAGAFKKKELNPLVVGAKV